MVHVMSETKLTPFGASASGPVSVGASGIGGTGVPFLSASTEQRLMNVEGRLRVLEQSLQGQRLRADTAEAELAKANKSADTYLAAWEKCAEFRDASEDKVKAAERRIAELSANNQQLSKLLGQALAALNPTARLAKEIKAALNPKPEAGSHE